MRSKVSNIPYGAEDVSYTNKGKQASLCPLKDEEDKASLCVP